MTKHEYAIFRKFYIELRKMSDLKVDGSEPMTRLKNLYLRQFDKNETEYADCNEEEKKILKFRKETAQWLDEDDLITELLKEAAARLAAMGEVGIDPVEAEINQRFVEQLLKVAKVNTEEVTGSHHETLQDIIEKQSEMDFTMVEIREKVK